MGCLVSGCAITLCVVGPKLWWLMMNGVAQSALKKCKPR
ncbi:Uncharacterised protein [Vibrio cholerae]|nr:Uncharacterised protein [Vibrio cholerae]